MKAIGKLFLFTSILIIACFAFMTGPMKSKAEQDLKNQGIFSAIGGELSGSNAQLRDEINMLANFNRILMGGSVLCLIVGTAAWVAGKT